MKIKVGIFFGGSSRDRERAYAGGRAVYEALDRALFEPFPIFVDSQHRFIALDWSNLYKRDIRQFYPPGEALRPSPNGFQVYRESLTGVSEEEQAAMMQQIGRPLSAEELPQLIDMAFLVLPGPFGADGQIQQLLFDLDIPFTGTDATGSRLNYERIRQKRQLVSQGIATPRYLPVDRNQWLTGDPGMLFREAARVVGFPLIVRPAHQRADIGLSVIDEATGVEAFTESVNGAFFREMISGRYWKDISSYDKADHLRLLTDPRDGLGFPIDVSLEGQQYTFHHPEDLLGFLDEQTAKAPAPSGFLLESHLEESGVLLEAQPTGQPFSCLVVQPDAGGVLPLLPVSGTAAEEGADAAMPYRRNQTPSHAELDLPASGVETIRRTCAAAFEALNCRVFARIEGIFSPEGQVYILGAETAPDFHPGAFLYRQMALTGLDPAQTLTCLLRNSLAARSAEFPPASSCRQLLADLDEQISRQQEERGRRKKIALLTGGDGVDRRRPLEQVRRIYWLLAGAAEYTPVALFSKTDEAKPLLCQLPPALIFEENLDSLREHLDTWAPSEAEEEVRANSRAIRQRYGNADTTYNPHFIELDDLPEWVDVVFLTLSGAPAGGDELLTRLTDLGIPYTGPRPEAMPTLQNRYRSLQSLRRNGIPVPRHLLLTRSDYEQDPTACAERLEQELSYPLLAMPPDELYPPAEMMIHNRNEFSAYCRLLFRSPGREALESRFQLKLRPKAPFPRKDAALFLAPVHAAGARQLTPVTCGLFTRYEEDELRYELLAPSERIAEQEFLTLQEQYRLNPGDCITPARFSVDSGASLSIAGQVRATFEKAARILQLEGYGRIEGRVRIFDDHRAETVVYDVQSLPPLTEDQCLPAQAVYRGFTPLRFIDEILIFAVDREVKFPGAGKAPAVHTTGSFKENHTELQPENHQYGHAEQQQHWLRETAGKVWDFLKSPFFLKNLGLWVGFLLLSFLILNFLLDQYTHHGESLQVQKYEGLKLEEAVRKARSRSFKIVVNDSVYREDMEPRVVLEQNPEAFSRVKENRRIYVVISRSTAPEVLLPSLEGAYNYDAYKRKLMQRGLKARITDRQFDNKLEENTILYFYYNGQRITENDLERGVKVPKGSLLEFVVTERLTEQVPAPDLRCKRYEAASFQISANELVVGEVIGRGDFVFRQDPPPGQMVRKGSQINLYLTETRPADCAGEEGAIEEEGQFEER